MVIKRSTGLCSHHLTLILYPLIGPLSKADAWRKPTPTSVPCYVHRFISNTVGHSRGAMQQLVIGPSSWRTRALPQRSACCVALYRGAGAWRQHQAPKSRQPFALLPFQDRWAARHAVAHVHDTRFTLRTLRRYVFALTQT
jgi:hypothetical protein